MSGWLIARSALVKLGTSPDAAEWAARARLTVLHVDKDFDLIASITGQPVERLALP